MKVDPEKFKQRDWKEHYSGFPPDLYYAPGEQSPWEKVPHLHLNYAIDGEMQSLTYKDKYKANHYLYSKGGKWDDNVFKMIEDSNIRAEALYAKTYI